MSGTAPTDRPAVRLCRMSYTLGLVTATIVLGLVGGGVMYRMSKRAPAASGPPEAGAFTRPLVRHYSDALEISEETLQALTEIGAVIANAANPTGVAAHDTPLVRPLPDDPLEYELRPGTTIEAYVLRSIWPYDLDPPIVFLPGNVDLPPLLSEYIEARTRMTYRYTITPGGVRRTLPEVQAADKLLIIGDSVAFGVGVNDDQTIASYLQAAVGERFEVINGAVGGYEARQSVTVAERLSASQPLRGLVYVACINDFHDSHNPEGRAGAALRRLAAIGDRCDDRVVVLLQYYVFYVMPDFFPANDREGWWCPERRARVDLHRRFIAKRCAESGLKYIDFMDIVEQQRHEQKTIFAPLSLYTDSHHLSPLGNRLCAEAIAAVLEFVE